MYLGRVHKTKEREFRIDAMEGVGETDATITIKMLSPGERRKVTQAAFHTTYTPDESGNLTPELEARNIEARESLFHKAVTGWTGFYEDEGGNRPLKFNMPGKKKLLDIFPEIADYVAECHEKMVNEFNEEREEVEKNSSSTSQD